MEIISTICRFREALTRGEERGELVADDTRRACVRISWGPFCRNVAEVLATLADGITLELILTDMQRMHAQQVFFSVYALGGDGASRVFRCTWIY